MEHRFYQLRYDIMKLYCKKRGCNILHPPYHVVDIPTPPECQPHIN